VVQLAGLAVGVALNTAVGRRYMRAALAAGKSAAGVWAVAAVRAAVSLGPAVELQAPAEVHLAQEVADEPAEEPLRADEPASALDTCQARMPLADIQMPSLCGCLRTPTNLGSRTRSFYLQ